MNKTLACFWYAMFLFAWLCWLVDFFGSNTVDSLNLLSAIAALALARTYKLEAER
jgi:hypothetical protein